jgi:hypothetical protein
VALALLLAEPGCESSKKAGEPQLLAGAAKANITPYVGAFLDGFRGRDKGCEGVHDELFAKALVLKSGETTVAIVACDLIGLTSDSVESIRREVEGATGIPGSQVMVTCTHTHAGPVTGLLRVPGLDPALVRVTEKKIAGAVAAAHGALAPARLGVGKGNATTGFNRHEIWGKAAPPPPGASRGTTDDEVGVIRVENAKGRPSAILVSYACHPIVLGERNNQVSADFPGAMAAFVEQTYEEAVCLFLNGAAGDINPTVMGRKIEHVRRLGATLGTEAARVARAIQPSREVRLAVRQTVLDLPLAPLPSLEEAKAALAQRTRELDEFLAKGKLSRVLYDNDWLRGWAQDVIAEHGKPARQTSRSIELQAIRLGDALLIAIPAETFVETGLAIKKASPVPNTFIVGYANGDLGYIPTAKAFGEGGYEITTGHKLYRGIYQLAPDAERLVREAAVGLAKEQAR